MGLSVFVFHQKVYNKRVIDIHVLISSKKRESLSLRIDQIRASHSFDPDSDSRESGFLELITISMTQ